MHFCFSLQGRSLVCNLEGHYRLQRKAVFLTTYSDFTKNLLGFSRCYKESVNRQPQYSPKMQLQQQRHARILFKISQQGTFAKMSHRKLQKWQKRSSLVCNLQWIIGKRRMLFVGYKKKKKKTPYRVAKIVDKSFCIAISHARLPGKATVALYTCFCLLM